RGRNEKVEVFEKRQDAEVDADARGNPKATPCRPFSTTEHLPDHIIDCRRPENQERKFPIPSGVKRVAADKEPHLSRAIVAHRPVDDEDEQEEPEKAKLNERHSNENGT